MKLGKLRTKDLTVLAMMVALNVVMAEIFKFPIIPKVLELSFGFVPIAVTGMLFGAVPAIIVAVIADIIGALIFSAGDFFFGFTFTAVMSGLYYGTFLHEEKVKLRHILLCQALVSIVCYAALNTLWTMMMGYGRTVQYRNTRLLVQVIAYPVYVVVLYLMTRYRKVLESAIK